MSVVETSDHPKPGFSRVPNDRSLFVKAAFVRADSLFEGAMLVREGGHVVVIERREELA